jgi:hypothetical protein
MHPEQIQVETSGGCKLSLRNYGANPVRSAVDAER